MNFEYSLYAHHQKDRTWNEKSYLELCTVDDTDTFWKLMNTIENQKLYETFSLFFMKHKIKPVWEDPQNKNGGCWSFKITPDNSEHTHDIWVNTCIKCISKEIIESSENVNGVSIIPKDTHIIIKVWVKNSNRCEFKKEFSELLRSKRGIYQPHQANIKKDMRKNTIYQYRRRNKYR